MAHRQRRQLSVTLVAAPFTLSQQTIVVLNVDSCHDAVAALRQRGVRCDEPVSVPGVVTYASFYDPDGNHLRMCSAPPEA